MKKENQFRCTARWQQQTGECLHKREAIQAIQVLQAIQVIQVIQVTQGKPSTQKITFSGQKLVNSFVTDLGKFVCFSQKPVENNEEDKSNIKNALLLQLMSCTS